MTHKKVLVADRIAKEGIDVLRDKGYDVDVKLDLTEDELAAQIVPYDAIVVRSATPVTRRVIEAAENLKIIGRAGVGVDTIDLDAATERGVIVTNPPYGERLMEKREAEALYAAFGAAYAKTEHWKLYLLSSHTEFERTFGRPADKKRKLYNGTLRCDLFQYTKDV